MYWHYHIGKIEFHDAKKNCLIWVSSIAKILNVDMVPTSLSDVEHYLIEFFNFAGNAFCLIITINCKIT